MKSVISQLASLGAGIKAAMDVLLATAEHLRKTNQTIKKEVAMWSNHIMDYPAHWLLIAHNSRNNRRTKRRK